MLNAVDYLLDDIGLMELRNKSLQIPILDKQRAFRERTYWQFINLGIPVLMLLVFGIGFHWLRKRKYQ